ncbi:MAG: hypothetical protein LBN18_00235, partial [Dysgonamonadaceae bacterium]|nr:hypothetical protein [Dysgonamonadaceae bacterium]
TFEFPYNGTITVNSGAALVIEGTTKLLDNNKIIVKSGGTLKFVSGSSINVSGNGYIELQSGSYFCISSGTTIKLNDQKSLIKLRQGYINGVNTAVLPSASCIANPLTYSITGNGKIVDYPATVYIQNETISTNRYIGGKNIYVGRNVTTSKPQGDVVITSGANVIFDAEENVNFEAGFDCNIGGTFEVIKQ